jgi:5-methylcytosine-specific restriction endonuclease McrA
MGWEDWLRGCYYIHVPRPTVELQRQFQRERNARIRRSWLEGKACRQCGSTERLEVDHIDPADKISHNVWSWTEARRAAELQKCQVLCHVCHKLKSAAELRKPIHHGTPWGYQKGCRCRPCTDAFVGATRERRKRRKAAGLRYT